MTNIIDNMTSIIKKTPHICGGNARIRNTRIPVWSLISFHQQGADDDYLLRNYPGLTPADLKAARSYYEQNRDEIDRIIADDEDDD